MSESPFSSVQHCFIPHDTDIFAVAEIVSYSAERGELTVLLQTQHVTLKASEAVPIADLQELNNPPADLIKLAAVHRPGILHTLRSRFQADEIYTSIGPILVAMNPFKWIQGIYGEDVMQRYKSGESGLSEQPHVFAVAQDAYSDLHLGNQSLIISGESGAGKTEATKQCLNHLAFLAGRHSKILRASPVLEAWGNAKTLRNNNSSRFGKFIEVWFDATSITGSANTTYLLEKSRVVFQQRGERNYHAFYQLIRGASEDLLRELELTDISARPETANFINQGCIAIDEVDDAADFQETSGAFGLIGFSPEEQLALQAVLAGLLHIGNVQFQENPADSESSVVTPDSAGHLGRCGRRLGVAAESLATALTYKQIRSGGGGRRVSVSYANCSPAAAADNRNSLAKEVYRRCFDHIVQRINELMAAGDGDGDGTKPGPESQTEGKTEGKGAVHMIGILDIFGFEIFEKV
ncbi:P-loop containing nucleoside triphosphate hydrolase protein [Ochromonadaceae sp. CCMP2298]|nr:P-loop containing nucleoside triphosphate hydrolase protein [Ochromonadaceae sp. CCMP2298]